MIIEKLMNEKAPYRCEALIYLKRKYLSDNYKEMKSYYWEARARSEGQMMLEVFWFKNSRDQNFRTTVSGISEFS